MSRLMGQTPIDSATGAAEVIEYGHHEVHGGSSYVVSDVQSVDTTSFKWQVTTPNTTKWAHMVFDLNCTGELLVVITEGSDRVDGTALAEINRNRNSANTAAVIATHTPTGGSTDGAVTIFSRRTGATGPGGSSGIPGAGRGGNEFILKQNTKYVIAVTTYATVFVTFSADWYEHTDKGL